MGVVKTSGCRHRQFVNVRVVWGMHKAWIWIDWHWHHGNVWPAGGNGRHHVKWIPQRGHR